MPEAYIGQSKNSSKRITYDLNTLTRHAAVVGTTGSGKTVMCKVIIEEALAAGIPVIAIDPKGDIASLAIVNKQFDFRPFGTMATAAAQKLAGTYAAKHNEQQIPKQKIDALLQIKTNLYTPKSSLGKTASFMPSLAAPKNFDAEDLNVVAALVDPVASSLVTLAGISGKSAEKIQAFLSTIITHEWSQGNSLTIEQLIGFFIKPPFENVGSLSVNDVMNEKERKKVASQLNILLTSPAKRIWSQGEALNVANMFESKTLSVFDLRYVPDVEEKQFVVEVILQQIYAYLLQKGGSEELKYILYIDELAGFLPAPPANPATKKQLELLIRQARAFGLGILLATQNPGDIDYKIFGNIGTRFIGKLRTDLDIEKIATGMGLQASSIKEQLSTVETGDFIYNNAVKNTTQLIHARWLYSFHGGPLSVQEIGWITNPKNVPTLEKKFVAEKPKREIVVEKEAQLIEAQDVLAQTQQIDRSPDTPGLSSKTNSVLKTIVNQVKEVADITQLKVAISDAQTFVPHLRIIVEPKELDGMRMPVQGPYIFDLTSKLIPIDNYLREVQFRTFISDDISIEKPTVGVSQSIKYAISDAKQKLRTPYYFSSLLKTSSKQRDTIVDMTFSRLKEKEQSALDKINDKLERNIKDLQFKIDTSRESQSDLSNKLFGSHASRFVKRLFGNKKVAGKTAEMNRWKTKKVQLKREEQRMNEKIGDLRRKAEVDVQLLSSKLLRKAQTLVKAEHYVPKDDDLKVTVTILLVPKRSHQL